MNIKNYVNNICVNAKLSSEEISRLTEREKNLILTSLAEEINSNRGNIKKSNSIDLDNLKSSNNFNGAFIDRLLIDDSRINSMIDSIKEIIEFKDPVGEINGVEKMPSGIKVGKMSMPLGVIAMIYESRPNVTVDASALCIKSGNSIILRGGSESINTNISLESCIKKALAKNNVNIDIVQLIDNTDRNIVNELLIQNNYIDIVIPRGGKNLIKLVDGLSNSMVGLSWEDCEIGEELTVNPDHL